MIGCMTNTPPSPEPERLNVADLPRNDVSKAIAFIERELDRNGRVSEDDMHVLYMLQDSRKDLVAAIQAMNAKRRAAGKAVLA